MTGRIEFGACFCGEIAGRLEGEPLWICFDHDSDCRRSSGAPMMVWVGCRPEQFCLLQGEPAVFSRTVGVLRSFCGRCGSPISYLDRGLPDELYLAVGFFDHPERLRPEAHAYCAERLPWIELADGLPQFEGYSRRRDPRSQNPRDRDTADPAAQ
ncbi:MAG: GFA family protein [Sinobacteraceae bacterium]|nr:GFA family protein [Nevskiaceae bacterium]